MMNRFFINLFQSIHCLKWNFGLFIFVFLNSEREVDKFFNTSLIMMHVFVLKKGIISKSIKT